MVNVYLAIPLVKNVLDPLPTNVKNVLMINKLPNSYLPPNNGVNVWIVTLPVMNVWEELNLILIENVQNVLYINLK